jgi:hypothetical protein
MSPLDLDGIPVEGELVRSKRRATPQKCPGLGMLAVRQAREGRKSKANSAFPGVRGTEVAPFFERDNRVPSKSKEVLVPDEKDNRGNRDNESRQTSGRDSSNRGGFSSNDRERDEKGRFESDEDFERGSSSSRGGSSSGSSGSSEGFSKKK